MSSDAYRHALRRRPLFTPLYAALAVMFIGICVLGWVAIGLWQAPATVFVVRHMEKLDGDDPALSPAGQARAERLAEMLASARIDAIYASQYRRTGDTAAPLAERLSLPVHRYDAARTERFIDNIRSRHRSDTIVIIGHSNTVPALVAALSGRDVGELSEDRYGDVFIVTVPRWGRAAVTRLYQAPPDV